MTDLLIATALGGLAHFLIGGIWYSPPVLGLPWMRGLGLTPDDIAGSRISLGAALAMSALSSLIQAAALVWLFATLGPAGVGACALAGAVLALCLGGGPMLRERVWTDRPWSVVLIDLGHEVLAGTVAAALAGWWLLG